MERGLLSDKKLAEFYDKVEWMYLFQDFSGSEADRTAQRIAIRFGITSWPQHFLVDPYTMEVIGDTGRSLTSFKRAVENAKVSDVMTPGRLAALDADAAAVERFTVNAEMDSDEREALMQRAREALAGEDTVIRYRALEFLVKHDMPAVLKASPDLLAVPNDQMRFTVLKLLAEQGDESACDALEELCRTTPTSKNPNVLRINAVKALERCGKGTSIPLVAGYAASGDFNNGLTGTALATTLKLVERFPDEKAKAIELLKGGFPDIPEIAIDAPYRERTLRSCTALAKRINDALNTLSGKSIAFPAEYTLETRAALIKAWE